MRALLSQEQERALANAHFIEAVVAETVPHGPYRCYVCRGFHVYDKSGYRETLLRGLSNAADGGWGDQ